MKFNGSRSRFHFFKLKTSNSLTALWYTRATIWKKKTLQLNLCGIGRDDHLDIFFKCNKSVNIKRK